MKAKKEGQAESLEQNQNENTTQPPQEEPIMLASIEDFNEALDHIRTASERRTWLRLAYKDLYEVFVAQAKELSTTKKLLEKKQQDISSLKAEKILPLGKNETAGLLFYFGQSLAVALGDFIPKRPSERKKVSNWIRSAAWCSMDKLLTELGCSRKSEAKNSVNALLKGMGLWNPPRRRGGKPK